jgi:hypothetical protein
MCLPFIFNKEQNDMIAVIDSRMPWEAQRALTSLGYKLCHLPAYPTLDTPVSGHPDMLVFFSRDAIYTTRSYAALAQDALEELHRHTKLPIVCTENDLQKQYPHDVLLNAAPIGNNLFCLPAHTADELQKQYRIFPVKQGYAKCSTLPIGEHALITEDPSIAKVVTALGIDVLEVRSNAVRLAGYSTGFLGGASSYSPYESTDTVLFCGALELHPNAGEIRDFCKKHQKTPISLGSFPLTDVGTIFLL